MVSRQRSTLADESARCPPARGCGSGGNAAVWRAAALSGCTVTTFSGRLLAERSCLPNLRIAASICLHTSGA